jgi:hypothetical protein
MKLARPISVLLFGCAPVVVACSSSSSDGPSSRSATTGGGASGAAGSSSSVPKGGAGGGAGSAGSYGRGDVNSDASSGAGSPIDAASTGTAGGSGAGGAGGPDGAGPRNPTDSGAGPTDGGASTVPPGGFGAGPITECPTPSLDRLQQWTAHANTTPASGNLLVKEGARYVARVTFPGGGAWSEVVVPVNNNETIPGDLSMSAGFTITYSATSDFWGQLRGTVQPHGGDQNVVKLPSTAGNMATLSFRFVPEDWTFVPGLGRPTVTLASVIKSAVFFDFVGNTANTVAFYDLRFDNYLPQCR